MINQRVARAFVRVHRPGALTFAAISEVGVGAASGRWRHRLNSHPFKRETVDVDYDDGDLEERVKPEFVLALSGHQD